MKQDEILKRIRKLENKVKILEIEVADKIEANAYPDEVEIRRIDWNFFFRYIAFSSFIMFLIVFTTVLTFRMFNSQFLAGVIMGLGGLFILTFATVAADGMVSYYKIPARREDDDC